MDGRWLEVGDGVLARRYGELGEVTALHAAVARGSLSATEAAHRSPYPGVLWPGRP